ncbi:hypothetical protein BBF96_14780 [Anoxybacter fermentans]|uniref:Uncharacterized protein n=1 Tax=Anoxybacter fermentans TaxID=1323375 RepID=A0A3Q9HSX5_9FIRM|nr:hypothetical protein [Anoxybacter fermentans]AZR74539.1 hypothetical protein BBF96_14780 [Anoxybacter fermentans]
MQIDEVYKVVETKIDFSREYIGEIVSFTKNRLAMLENYANENKLELWSNLVEEEVKIPSQGQVPQGKVLSHKETNKTEQIYT